MDSNCATLRNKWNVTNVYVQRVLEITEWEFVVKIYEFKMSDLIGCRPHDWKMWNIGKNKEIISFFLTGS